MLKNKMVYEPKAKIKTIRAEISLTLPVKDRYYKFTFSQEREMPQTGAIEKKEIDALWQSSRNEINKQIRELCKTLDYKYEKLL